METTKEERIQAVVGSIKRHYLSQFYGQYQTEWYQPFEPGDYRTPFWHRNGEEPLNIKEGFDSYWDYVVEDIYQHLKHWNPQYLTIDDTEIREGIEKCLVENTGLLPLGGHSQLDEWGYQTGPSPDNKTVFRLKVEYQTEHQWKYRTCQFVLGKDHKGETRAKVWTRGKYRFSSIPSIELGYDGETLTFNTSSKGTLKKRETNGGSVEYSFKGEDGIRLNFFTGIDQTKSEEGIQIINKWFSSGEGEKYLKQVPYKYPVQIGGRLSKDFEKEVWELIQ